MQRITDNALDDSIVAGLTQLVLRENLDGFEDLHRLFGIKMSFISEIYFSTMNSVDILIEDDDLIQAALALQGNRVFKFLNVTLVLIEKDFFNILPPSSDEDNGATNDFGESFDFDGNYTLNGTFDDHLGTDK